MEVKKRDEEADRESRKRIVGRGRGESNLWCGNMRSGGGNRLGKRGISKEGVSN